VRREEYQKCQTGSTGANGYEFGCRAGLICSPIGSKTHSKNWICLSDKSSRGRFWRTLRSGGEEEVVGVVLFRGKRESEKEEVPQVMLNKVINVINGGNANSQNENAGETFVINTNNESV